MTARPARTTRNRLPPLPRFYVTNARGVVIAGPYTTRTGAMTANAQRRLDGEIRAVRA